MAKRRAIAEDLWRLLVEMKSGGPNAAKAAEDVAAIQSELKRIEQEAKAGLKA